MNMLLRDKISSWSLWIKISYTILAAIIFLIYLYKYGAENFLWFSDIAFFAMVPALWLNSRIIASMMAIGVLPIEILWLIGLLSDGNFLGLANYMYDDTLPLWLRLLSFYHFPMIGAIIYMIYQFGYDKRALIPQIFCSLFIIYLTYQFSDRGDNINMVYPPKDISSLLSDKTYFILMPLVLILCFIIPAHLFLKKFCPVRLNKVNDKGE